MSTNSPTPEPSPSLAEVERVVGSWCEGADPALWSGADAAVAVERLARVVRRLQAKQASFAVRVEACHSQSRRYGSSEEYLARVNGTSRSDAKATIDTARRLGNGTGAAKDAFDRGELSLGEAKVISAAVAVDPSAEADLVAAAKSHDLAGVREQAEKVKTAARCGEDPVARRARLRAQRCWREFDRDGMREVMASFVKDDWIAVAPVVQAYLDAVYDQARRQGRRDPIDAYRADAVLAALAAAGTAAGLAPTLPTPRAAVASPAPTAAGATSGTTTGVASGSLTGRSPTATAATAMPFDLTGTTTARAAINPSEAAAVRAESNMTGATGDLESTDDIGAELAETAADAGSDVIGSAAAAECADPLGPT